jgi:ABC-type enterobactin transport system permease subunit
MSIWLTSVFLATLATAALAHEGAHLHPHADSPLWWPVVAGMLAAALAAMIVARRK